jgi:hypothetical protein
VRVALFVFGVVSVAAFMGVLAEGCAQSYCQGGPRYGTQCMATAGDPSFRDPTQQDPAPRYPSFRELTAPKTVDAAPPWLPRVGHDLDAASAADAPAETAAP